MRKRRNHRRLALVVATTWILLLVLGPYALKPWGPATPPTRDLVAFWNDVPLVTDFVSFWTAATLLRQGNGPALFDPRAQQSFQTALREELGATQPVRDNAGVGPYFNPPALALLFAPLTLLPMPVAFLLWSAISLLAFLAAAALPLRGRPLARVPAVVMLTYAGVADTLLWGQVNGVFVLAFSLGLLAMAAGRPALGGALLGVMWLKPQQAVLFPLVFLVKGRWRELAGMAAAGLGLLGLSLAAVGPGGIGAYVEMLWRLGGYYPPPFTSTAPERMANWRGLLMHVAPGLPESTGTALVLALGAVTAAASLLAWRGTWDPASPRFARQMLVVALAGIVASPHSHFHATVLLLAPLAVTLARPMPAGSLARLWYPLLWLGYLLALATWPFRTLSWLLVPYCLIAIALLSWEHPHPTPRGKLVDLLPWTSSSTK